MTRLSEIDYQFFFPIAERKTITMELPGDDDDPADGEGDWSDVDDEDFEDRAEDQDDLHEIELDDNIFDPEDDDHLPPEEDF